MSDFQYPPFYSFPPFFTVQPVLDTKQKQIRLWSQFVLSYCKHHRIEILDVKSALVSPLFANEAIHRALPLSGALEVLDALAATGHLEWVNKKAKERALVMWRSPAEWGALLHAWAVRTGNTDSMLTAYEVLEGDDTQTEEFHNLSLPMFRKAIAALANGGRAEIIDAESMEEIGVKFYVN
jgi:ESCRT-II complex subunit VPS25